MPLIVCRYHEITLKRGNRARFAAQLIDNLRRATVDLPIGRIADLHGRIVLVLREESAWAAARERLERVFGVANFSLAKSAALPGASSNDFAPLEQAVLGELAPRRFESFRVVTRRADKRFRRASAMRHMPAIPSSFGFSVGAPNHHTRHAF